MYFQGIIPARYASTRFPGKPLALINGKPMIQHVFENASRSLKLSSIFVATDDARIEKTVIGFGGKAIMTSSSHPSGTDRCFEAALKTIPSECQNDQSIIINIQGDEPFIDPLIIDLLIASFENPSVQIATLAKVFDNETDLFSPNSIKVVCDKNDDALYFSRSVIPFVRNTNCANWFTQQSFLQHIGIYAYRFNTLKLLTSLHQSPLEKAESLEQLRWIENGFRIRTILTEYKGHSIDSPEDIEKLPI